MNALLAAVGIEGDPPAPQPTPPPKARPSPSPARSRKRAASEGRPPVAPKRSRTPAGASPAPAAAEEPKVKDSLGPPLALAGRVEGCIIVQDRIVNVAGHAHPSVFALARAWVSGAAVRMPLPADAPEASAGLPLPPPPPAGEAELMTLRRVTEPLHDKKDILNALPAVPPEQLLGAHLAVMRQTRRMRAAQGALRLRRYGERLAVLDAAVRQAAMAAVAVPPPSVGVLPGGSVGVPGGASGAAAGPVGL